MFVQSYKQKNEIANAEAYFKGALKMVVCSGSKKFFFAINNKIVIFAWINSQIDNIIYYAKDFRTCRVDAGITNSSTCSACRRG